MGSEEKGVPGVSTNIIFGWGVGWGEQGVPGVYTNIIIVGEWAVESREYLESILIFWTM